MNFWLVLTVNSITFGGLLFLLSAGFSLIFGLMRIPNLTHGSLFMLGAYIGATFVIGILGVKMNFWLAALLATLTVALLGALAERMLLRRLPGDQLAQVLVTLGLSFMAADFCLMVWGGDPLSVTTPPELAGFARFGVLVFPNYRLAIIVIAFVVAIGLWLLLDRTRLGAMIRAGVDDPDMARVVGIRVSQLFTIVFALGAGLAAFAGIIGGPILSVYPGLDQDMLPLALVVVILGGTGSLLGSFVGSIIVGFIYNFGQALLPELASVRYCRRLRSARDSALLDARHLLHQCRQPDPVLRRLRARAECAGGICRPGFAWPRRSFRCDRLRRRLHVAAWLRPSVGDPRRTGDRRGLNGNLCRVVAALDRHRLHHDHVGAGRNPLGARLSLDQPDRWR
jgi:branched-chain amino acid transport system permease protein